MQCTPSRLHTSSCRTSFQVTRSRSLPSVHDWPLRVRLSCRTGLASCLSASSYGRSSWSRTRSSHHYRGPRPTISLRCSRMLRASTGATRAIEGGSGRITCARRRPQPGRRFFSALRGPELAQSVTAPVHHCHAWNRGNSGHGSEAVRARSGGLPLTHFRRGQRELSAGAAIVWAHDADDLVV
jgi:hypothetical protein